MQSHASVVSHRPSGLGNPGGHEAMTLAACAQQLATFLDLRYAGELEAAGEDAKPAYLVPAQTLVIEAARALGVTREADLFGGVVPHPFVATKTITHPLVDASATAPPGWSHAFPRHVADVVHAGFSAFSRQDAWRAGLLLLQHGDIRVKPALATGGAGQTVVRNRDELQQALATVGEDEFADGGVVIEVNLSEVETYSVGQVRTGGMLTSYCGTQQETRNHHGRSVYGGSTLTLVRGDFAMLLALSLPENARLAIAQARHYDAEAERCYEGLFASRRNYDVAQGRDPAGEWRSGVLEQSWRLGGASTAELCALLAFKANPGLHRIQATSVEVYAEDVAVPGGATVYYRGMDPRLGPLTKFAMCETYADAR